MGLFGLLKSNTQPVVPKFRLAVFLTEEMLPCPLQVVHPDGLGKAMVGEAVVLNGKPNPNLWLEQSMDSGDYLFRGLAADVKASVSPLNNGALYTLRDMAGSLNLLSSMDTEERNRLEFARWVITLDTEFVRSSVWEAVLFETELADRFAMLAGGMVYDHAAQRCSLPGMWRLAEALKPLDAREHVVLHLEPREDGTLWVHTHGLSKFCRPELEVRDLPTELAVATCQMMVKLSQRLVAGASLRQGGTALHLGVPLYVNSGSEESASHVGGQMLELVDAGRNGKPAERGATRGIGFYVGVSGTVSAGPMAAGAR